MSIRNFWESITIFLSFFFLINQLKVLRFMPLSTRYLRCFKTEIAEKSWDILYTAIAKTGPEGYTAEAWPHYLTLFYINKQLVSESNTFAPLKHLQ